MVNKTETIKGLMDEALKLAEEIDQIENLLTRPGDFGYIHQLSDTVRGIEGIIEQLDEPKYLSEYLVEHCSGEIEYFHGLNSDAQGISIASLRTLQRRKGFPKDLVLKANLIVTKLNAVISIAERAA